MLNFFSSLLALKSPFSCHNLKQTNKNVIMKNGEIKASLPRYCVFVELRKNNFGKGKVRQC